LKIKAEKRKKTKEKTRKGKRNIILIYKKKLSMEVHMPSKRIS
jgi:hypothetical protein